MRPIASHRLPEGGHGRYGNRKDQRNQNGTAMKLDGNLVTVFGGGGFLGRYVCEKLLRAGARVRVAERHPSNALHIKPLGNLGQTQFASADVTRRDTVDRAVAGSAAVVNLVGAFDNMQAVHADGARNIAEAAASAGANALVHISAIGADPASASAYGRSKGDGEAAVRTAFPAATILRPSIVFGREDQFINRFADMIVSLPVVPVIAPEAKFQPVFVGDVAAAVLTALTQDSAHAGQTYALGGPEVLTMRGLNERIAKLIGRDKLMVDVPAPVASILATVGSFIPGAPITRDQYLMLQSDNVVGDQPGLDALGITPTALNVVAADEWLDPYRNHGRFAARAAAG